MHDVPDDFATITSALAAASPTDTVRVAPGAFSPSSNGESFPLWVPDGIVLIGDGWPTTTLDAEGSAGVMILAGAGDTRDDAAWSIELTAIDTPVNDTWVNAVDLGNGPVVIWHWNEC